MKHLMIATVASLGLISAAAAQSSSTTVTTTTGGAAATTSGTTVTIQPEVRTKVKEYVTTSKPKAVTAPSGFTVSTGAVLPEAIEIQSFPATVGVTQYRYAVIGDQTVLVDPGSRRIIEVIR